MSHPSEEIVSAVVAFEEQLEAHPECRGDLAAEAALAGKPRRHAAFYLGRFPDIEQGEGKPAPPPPPRTPEERLLDWLKGAAGPLEMLNPISPVRNLGKGTGSLPASFGIRLNPELGFAPEGARPLDDVLKEGMPDPETSGIFPEMREDIDATKALTPDWVEIALPDMQGPFNIAHMVLGDDAFIAPLTEPDHVAGHRLLYCRPSDPGPLDRPGEDFGSPQSIPSDCRVQRQHGFERVLPGTRAAF